MKSLAISPRHAPRTSSPRVCWRRDLAVPHESLWGRWNKLELFNRAARRDIQEYLRDLARERERSWERSSEPGDSRIQGVLDARKLTELSAPGYARTTGVIADYLPDAEKSRWERDLWSAKDLRYCPQCLKVGVHVTYFQFHFVERCPVHDVKLATRCPSCRTSIDYRHGRDGCSSRFACSCRRALWNWEKKPVCRVSADLKNRHAEAGEWIRAATRHGKMLHFPWEYDPHNDKRSKEADRVPPFATLVALVHPELGRLPSNFNRKLEDRIVTSSIGGSRLQRRTSERVQLAATYKSICRYYRRRLLRRHQAAIAEISRMNGRPLSGSFGELDWPMPFAPAASALVAWRMYWEGVKSPKELRGWRGRYVPIERADRGPLHWTITLQERFYDLVSSPTWKRQKRLSSEIRLRWFAEVCMRVFDECLLRIHDEFRKKHPIDGRCDWHFTTKWINGALVPYMLPRCEKDGRATLFWLSKYRRSAEIPCLARTIDHAPGRADIRAYNEAENRIYDLLFPPGDSLKRTAGADSEAEASTELAANATRRRS